MKASEFVDQAVAAGATLVALENVNTNNAWGFGGRRGTDYCFRDAGDGRFVLNTGELCYRHLPSAKITVVSVLGIHKRFTPALFLKLFKEGGLPAVRQYDIEQRKRQ